MRSLDRLCLPDNGLERPDKWEELTRGNILFPVLCQAVETGNVYHAEELLTAWNQEFIAFEQNQQQYRHLQSQWTIAQALLTCAKIAALNRHTATHLPGLLQTFASNADGPDELTCQEAASRTSSDKWPSEHWQTFVRQWLSKIPYQAPLSMEWAWDVIKSMWNHPRQVAHSEQLTVLLVIRKDGLTATLTLERLADEGNGVLYPDPETMGFVPCDDDFQQAAQQAMTYIHKQMGRTKHMADVRWKLVCQDGRPLTRLNGSSAGTAFALGLAKLFAESKIEERYTGQVPGQIQMVELSQVAITATIDLSGRLGPIGGIWEKLLAAAEDAAKIGVLRVVVVSKEQQEELLKSEASPLRVIQAATLQEVVEKLYEEHGPRFAVHQWERQQCETLEILDRAVPLEKYYQVLPLLQEVVSLKLTEQSFKTLRDENIPEDILKKLESLKNKEFIGKKKFLEAVKEQIGEEQTVSYKVLILKHARKVRQERLPPEKQKDKMPNEKKDSWNELHFVEILRWEEKLQEEKGTYNLVTLEQVFDDFRTQSEVPRFVVLGPPGSGKTTLVQYIAWRLVNRSLSISGRYLLPVRVRLRDWERWAINHPESSLPEYLTEHYTYPTPAPTKEQWQGWLQRGDLLLLLDGLDEISHNTPFLNTLKTALSIFENCSTVLTCRTISFDRHRVLCPDFPVFTLSGLDDVQRDAHIRAFPAKYPDHYTPETLIEQLNHTPLMHPLAANPLLLAIMCFVVDDPHGAELPATRGELYGKAVDKLLMRRRRDDEIKYPGEPPDLADKRCILERVAFMLFARMEQQQRLISDGRTLSNTLKKAVKQEGYHTDPAPMANALRTEFTKNSGILRGEAEQEYFFLHLTIQEFLTAAAIARMVNEEEKGWEAAISTGLKTCTVREFVDKKAWNLRWYEVIMLLAGQLDDPVPLLKMLSQPVSDDSFRHRLALSAHCLTELRSEIRDSKTQIVDLITTDTFFLWQQHSRNITFSAIPHLTRALPALAQVNGRIVFPQNSIPFLDYLCELLHDRRKKVREQAMLTIQHLGSVAATPAILTRLAELLHDKKKDVQLKTAQAIEKIGSVAATEPAILTGLADLLCDQKEEVREAAVQTIDHLGKAIITSEFFDYLAEAYRYGNELDPHYTAHYTNSRDSGVRDSVLQVLRNIEKRTNIPEISIDPPTLECNPGDELKEKATEVIEWLENLTITQESLARLATLLRDRNWYVRWKAVEAIERIGSAAGTEPALLTGLAELLHDSRKEVRWKAAEAIERIGSAAGAEPAILTGLAKLLYDSEKEVRWQAARAVQRIGSLAATKPLILTGMAELLHDGEKELQWLALGALQNIGSIAIIEPAIIAGLDDLFSDPDWNMRWKVAQAALKFWPFDPDWITWWKVVQSAREDGSIDTPKPEFHFLDDLANLLRDPKKEIRLEAVETVQSVGSVVATRSEILSALAELFSDPDWKIRGAPAWALGRVGSIAAKDPKILRGLAELLHDKKAAVRAEAAKTIQNMGSVAATESEILAGLADLLQDRKKSVREEAVYAVESIGSMASTQKIIAALSELTNDPYEDIQAAVVDAVESMGSAIVLPESLTGLRIPLPQITKYIAGFGEKRTNWLGLTFGGMPATPENLESLATQLHDRKKSVRMSATRTIQDMGSAAATPEIFSGLADLLCDFSWEVRWEAEIALGHFGNAAASSEFLSYFIELLKEYPFYGWSIGRAVERIGTAAATPEFLSSLADLMRDPNERVRAAAADVIGGLGRTANPPTMFPEILDNLDLKYEGELVATPEILACLTELLGDPNGRVQAAAASAVSSIGSAASTPTILARLAKLFCDRDEKVRWCAARAVRGIGSDATTEPAILPGLASLLHDRKKGVREGAARAVGSIGSAVAHNRDILTGLAKLLYDRSKDVREAAAEAVGGIGSEAATPDILSGLAKLLHDRHKDVRGAAVKAVQSIGCAAAKNPEILTGLADRLRTLWDLFVESARGDPNWMKNEVFEAIDAIGSAVATPEFLASLAAMFCSKIPGRRNWSAQALGRLMAHDVRIFEKDGKYEAQTVEKLSRIEH